MYIIVSHLLFLFKCLSNDDLVANNILHFLQIKFSIIYKLYIFWLTKTNTKTKYIIFSNIYKLLYLIMIIYSSLINKYLVLTFCFS